MIDVHTYIDTITLYVLYPVPSVHTYLMGNREFPNITSYKVVKCIIVVHSFLIPR